MNKSAFGAIQPASALPRLVLIVSGGVLQNIISTHPADVVVVDYDVEGSDAPGSVADDKGRLEPCNLSRWTLHGKELVDKYFEAEAADAANVAKWA